MVQLSNATLDQLQVPGPTYDRSKVTTGIVHFGVGGFHRAHEAMYLDRLMTEGKAHDWAVCGVGVMPADQRMRDVLRAQDGLYTLVVKAPGGQLRLRSENSGFVSVVAWKAGLELAGSTAKALTVRSWDRS